MDRANEKSGYLPICVAQLVVFDNKHDSGLGDNSRTAFELWLLPPWLQGFCLKFEDSQGRQIGTAVFKATARTRQFKGRTVRQFELIQLLPHGLALPFQQVRLTTFATQLQEFS